MLGSVRVNGELLGTEAADFEAEEPISKPSFRLSEPRIAGK